MRSRSGIKVSWIASVSSQPAEVGLLERADRREPGAEAVADDFVERLGVAGAGGDERDRLALQRVLEPVADEAGDVGRRAPAACPAPRRKAIARSDRVGFGRLRLDHLDQRDQVGRVPEVGAEHPARGRQRRPRSGRSGSPRCWWRAAPRPGRRGSARRRSPASPPGPPGRPRSPRRPRATAAPSESWTSTSDRLAELRRDRGEALRHRVAARPRIGSKRSTRWPAAAQAL